MLIHVVLVSDQVIPNLVPALMDRPAKVYLVATDAMKQKGLPQRLKAVLQRHNVTAEILSGAPAGGHAAGPWRNRRPGRSRSQLDGWPGAVIVPGTVRLRPGASASNY